MVADLRRSGTLTPSEVSIASLECELINWRSFQTKGEARLGNLFTKPGQLHRNSPRTQLLRVTVTRDNH